MIFTQLLLKKKMVKNIDTDLVLNQLRDVRQKEVNQPEEINPKIIFNY